MEKIIEFDNNIDESTECDGCNLCLLNDTKDEAMSLAGFALSKIDAIPKGKRVIYKDFEGFGSHGDIIKKDDKNYSICSVGYDGTTSYCSVKDTGKKLTVKFDQFLDQGDHLFFEMICKKNKKNQTRLLINDCEGHPILEVVGA